MEETIYDKYHEVPHGTKRIPIPNPNPKKNSKKRRWLMSSERDDRAVNRAIVATYTRGRVFN